MVNMIWTHSLFWDFEFWHLRFVYVDIHPEPFEGTLNLLRLGIWFHLLLPEQFVQRHKNRSWNLYRLQVQIQPKFVNAKLPKLLCLVEVLGLPWKVSRGVKCGYLQHRGQEFSIRLMFHWMRWNFVKNKYSSSTYYRR